MADLKQNTTIGGSTIWTQANLPVQPSGNSVSYRGFKIYTTNDKPTPDDVGALAKTGGTLTGDLIGVNATLREVNVNYRLNLVRNAGFYPYIVMARSDADPATPPTAEQTQGTIEFRMNSTDGNPAAGVLLGRLINSRMPSGGGRTYLSANNASLVEASRFFLDADNGVMKIDRGNLEVSNALTAGATTLNSTLKVNGVSTLAAINASGAVALTNTLSVQGQTQLTGGLMTTTLSTTSTIDSSGELIVRQANLIRGISGTIGFIIRSDTAKTYFLHTAANNQEGSWNAARPLTIDKASGQVQIGNSLSGNSLTVVGGQAVDTVSVSGATSLGATTTLATTSGSWIDMRTQPAYTGNAVTSNAASALLRQEHANYHFVVGGLGNGQFGFYRIDKSRTTNGTDGQAFLDSAGIWRTGSRMEPNDYSNFDNRYARTNTDGTFNALNVTGGNMYIKNDGNSVIWLTNAAGNEKSVLFAEANGTFNIRVGGSRNYQFGTDGDFIAPSRVRAAGAIFYTDGNLTGSGWSNNGWGDAISGVNWCRDRSNDAWNKANDAQVNKVNWVRWGATNNFGALIQTANQRIIDAGWVLIGLNGTGGQQNNSMNLIGGRIQVHKDSVGWVDSAT